MYVTISRYEGAQRNTEDLVKTVRDVTSGLSRTPGFISFLLIEADAGVLLTVVIYEDRSELAAADQRVRNSLTVNLDGHEGAPAPTVAGQIIFQRGW